MELLSSSILGVKNRHNQKCFLIFFSMKLRKVIQFHCCNPTSLKQVGIFNRSLIWCDAPFDIKGQGNMQLKMTDVGLGGGVIVS